MSMKKNMKSGKPVIVSGGNEDKMFPVGYKYIMDGITWTVVEAKRADNTELRRLVGDEGTQEFVTVDTMRKDHDPLRNPGGIQVIEMPEAENAPEAAESDSEDDG